MKAVGSGILDAYMQLAVAILASAVKENDTQFFNSEWYSCLKDTVGSYYCGTSTNCSTVRNISSSIYSERDGD